MLGVPIGVVMSDSFMSSSVVRVVEDAILLGNVREIDAVLNSVEDDEDFPSDLRHGLEVLRHFRAHYGHFGMAPPTSPVQKQQVALMEAAWGAELLDMLHHAEGFSAVKLA